MKLDYVNLLVNENAYFYKLRHQLTKAEIEAVFKAALADKKSGERAFEWKIREPYVHGNKEVAKISIDVFKYNKRPSFLTKDVKNTFETKFGLFMIVETNDLIAVIKKNVSGLKHFYSFIEKIDYSVLLRFLLKNSSKFEKITASNMNVAGRGMQRKIAEAYDLQTVLSRFGTSKQIISSLRIANKESKSTVTVDTSRVNSFNLHRDFEKALTWMVDMMNLIRRSTKALPTSGFVDSFATPISYTKIIDQLRPTYLVIQLQILKDEIDFGVIVKMTRESTGKKIDFTDIEAVDRLIELKEDASGTYKNSDISLKVKETFISFLIPSFKDIVLHYDDDYTIDLNAYLNQRDNFLVVFDKYQYVYSHRMIFEDSKLLGDTENFMDSFITYNELIDIESEKGKDYLPTTGEFTLKSLFRFVEGRFAAESEYLLCDDMGTEWGDFISVGKEDVTFFHLKHNEKGLSASNLQEVFGQAQKNFGYLQLTTEMIEQRREKWSKNYIFKKVQTSIKRMRKSPPGKGTIDDLIAHASQTTSNPNVRRKVFVVVNFISKSELSKMLAGLKKGKVFKNDGVILQMLWLIHGNLALASDLGAEFRILCRP
jgi:hypothetical protein